MTSLDWTLLNSFLAVLETRSLSAAAQRLSLNQSTLSRHIRDLEAQLGIPLFARTSRGLDPTDEALVLVDDVRAMGVAADALALKAWGRSQQLTGTVRITTSVMVANFWLPPMLAELRSQEPRIQIEIVPSDLNQDLLRRDADIAIRMSDPGNEALIARRLGDAPVGLYGARTYLEQRGRPRTVPELMDHDLVGFDASEAILKLYAAAGHPTTRDAFALRCDDEMVCWNLMLAGAGIGFAQLLIAQGHPTLERVPIELMKPMPVWLVMREEVRSNARVRRVADFLSGAVTELLTRDVPRA